MARLAQHGSQRGILDALNRLAEQGLVRRDEAGNAFLYSLNRDHLAARAAEILSGLRTELIARLERAIDGWAIAPVHASLFGSAARGDGDADSDIDVLVVRSSAVEEDYPKWRAQIDDLAAAVRRWTGNNLSVAEVDAEEFERLSSEAVGVLTAVRTDGIRLAGDELAGSFDAGS